MKFVTVYARVLGLLKPDRGIAIALAAANLGVMGFQFAEPVLFGKVINLLSRSDNMTGRHVMGGAEKLLAIWAVIGLCGIGANILAIPPDMVAPKRPAMANVGARPRPEDGALMETCLYALTPAP